MLLAEGASKSYVREVEGTQVCSGLWVEGAKLRTLRAGILEDMECLTKESEAGGTSREQAGPTCV